MYCVAELLISKIVGSLPLTIWCGMDWWRFWKRVAWVASADIAYAQPVTTRTPNLTNLLLKCRWWGWGWIGQRVGCRGFVILRMFRWRPGPFISFARSDHPAIPTVLIRRSVTNARSRWTYILLVTRRKGGVCNWREIVCWMLLNTWWSTTL